MTQDGFVPLKFQYRDIDDVAQRADRLYDEMKMRKSIRDFSDREVPKAVVEKIIAIAGTAPSGANKQPWTFCLISKNDLRSKIREAAEKEEYENYNGRMSDEWLEDLSPFGTDWHKPFIDIAPWIIVMFKKAYDVEDGLKKKNYYVNESVGIAAGFLIMAIHQAGLATLTHTPSPMNFLQKILERPDNERAFLLLPVGYPAEDAMVPDITKKPLGEIKVDF
jgi:nitroreductase